MNDDALFPREGTNITRHRRWLKLWLAAETMAACFVNELGIECNRRGTNMHEAIRRSKAQGWHKRKRVLIFTPYNCVLLCDAHHETADEPSMYEIADYMLAKHGVEYLQWLASLPFKDHPLKGLLERHQDELAILDKRA